MIPSRPDRGRYVTVTWAGERPPVERPIPTGDHAVDRIPPVANGRLVDDIIDVFTGEYDDEPVARVRALPTVAAGQYTLRDRVVPVLERDGVALHREGFYSPCVRAAIRCERHTDRTAESYLDDLVGIRTDLGFQPDATFVVRESVDSWADRWESEHGTAPDTDRRRQTTRELALYDRLSEQIDHVETVPADGERLGSQIGEAIATDRA